MKINKTAAHANTFEKHLVMDYNSK